MRLGHLVRKNVRELAPYSSARDEFWGEDNVLLDANENPYESDVNRYPDPYQRVLKARISAQKGVSSENIFIGNGSDEIIDLIFRCFCEPKIDTAYAIRPSYGMYKVSAGVNNVDMHYCSLNSDFSLCVDQLLSGIKETDKLIFLCSPNNPTGNVFSVEDISQILEAFDGIVILDEAYIDFANTESMIDEVVKYDNLIILQTMSKAWGAAGLRLGLGFMNAEIITYFNKIKPPYNINSLSQNKAIELMDNSDTYQYNLRQIIDQRKILQQDLLDCPTVIKIYPSEANFILVKFMNAKAAFEKLKSEGIIVRDRSNSHLCEGCLRLSVGKSSENSKMIGILKDL